MLKGLFRNVLRRAPPDTPKATGEGDLGACLQRANGAVKAGDVAAAEAALRRGMAEHPTAGILPGFLAEILRQAGRVRESLEWYRKALALDPAAAELRFGYACALAALGDAAARSEYQRLVGERPNWAPPRVNLALLELNAGRVGDAVALLREAVALQPSLDEARVNLALALRDSGHLGEAEAECRAVLERSPDHLGALRNLASVLLQMGDGDAARECLAQRNRLAPADGALVAAAFAIPAIPESTADIDRVRDRLDGELAALEARALQVGDPWQEIGVLPFFIAYHGRDDRALQERIAALHLRACPALGYVALHCTAPRRPRDGRIRVGFLSRYFYDHSIGHVVRGLTANLDRARFALHVFGFREPFDATSREIAGHAEVFTVLPNDVFAAQRAIAGHELDVLLHADVGMDPFTYYLALARLAHVQCTTWGHPNTTGVPAMDYFLSTEHFEPEGAEAHYSERLERLRDVAFPGLYPRPAMPPPAAREALGFDPSWHVYFCPQNLFKFHPEFDAVLAAILRRDPRGRICIVGVPARDGRRLDRLRRRLQHALGDVADRLVILPRAPGRDGYLQRLQAADVVLDTLHYCGGNTSLEAISAGALVVTLPGAFNRGRHTYGFLRKVGFTDTVARTSEDYVEIAVRIAADREYRETLKREQAARVHALYDDRNAVRQIEDFFARAVDAAR